MRRCATVDSGPHAKRARESEEVISKEDHFSTLPDECLLSVFRFIDSADLDNLMLLNQRVHGVAKQPFILKDKIPAAVQISRDHPGYRVYLSEETDAPSSSSAPANTFKSHPINCNKSSTAIDKLFAFIVNLLRKYTITHLEWSYFIPLTEEFIDKATLVLANVLKDAALRFRTNSVNRQINLKKLEKLVLSTKSRRTTITIRELQGYLQEIIFDGQFLIEYTSCAPNQYITLEVDMGLCTKRLTVTPDLFPVICRFGCLKLDSLNIEPDALIDLILMRLEMEKEYTYWELHVNSPVTDEIFAKVDKEKYPTEQSNFFRDRRHIQQRGVAFAVIYSQSIHRCKGLAKIEFIKF